jgi:ketopantoate reductase
LNGLVVNKGKEAGVATETSQAIVSLIHAIEQGQAKPNPDAVAQLAI